MRIARKGIPVISVLVLLLVGLACIHKSGGKVTPWERLSTYNASFSEAVNTVELGTEAAAASCSTDASGATTCLISTMNAEPVIRFVGRAAQAHQKINGILQAGSNVSAGDLQTVQDLLTQIGKDGADLVRAGNLGIKNPRSTQTIATDVELVTQLANTIIGQLALFSQNPAPPIPKTSNGEPSLPYRGNGMAFWLSFGIFGMALSAATIEQLIVLVLQAGPLAVKAFLSMEALLNLGPDEKANIAEAFRRSNVTDQDTIDHANAWLAKNNLKPL